MDWGRIAGLSLLMLGLAGPSGAAEKPTLADAAEQRNQALIRTLLDAGTDVNAAQVDGMTALHWAVYHDDAETAGLLVRSGANVNAANRYGVPPLSLACTNGNADLVKLLLEAGADKNASLQGGETILMTAARAGSLEAVKALLARGADPNARERQDQTALMWAAAEGHAAVVQTLIDAGADFQAKLKSGFTPMFFAVREGHIDVVRTLLKAGVDVNSTLHRDEEGPRREGSNASYAPVAKGTSSLLMAVENGHFELAVALVKAGADPNDRRTGFTPLHAMTWVRKPDATAKLVPPIGSGSLSSLQFVRTLVELGANVNARLDEDAPRPPDTNPFSVLRIAGATPFLLAADREDVSLMRLLLELGADPFLPNLDHTTPLMAAAGLGTDEAEEAGPEPEALETVQFLLGLGADVNAVDNNGDTAMHGAAYGNFPAVVQLLADSGADIDIWKRPNKRGGTPLFIAEGYRLRFPKASPPTIAAVEKLMLAAGVPTDGPRPQMKDFYEKPVPVPPQKP